MLSSDLSGFRFRFSRFIWSLLVKWHVLKDVRRTAEMIGPLNSSLCFAREVDILRNLQYRKSAIGVKLPRPVFPVQCHTSDSMPHIDENDKTIEIEEDTVQKKKQEIQKDNTWDSSPISATKPLLKKSSRFIPASFFSFQVDETEFTPASMFNGLIDSAREQLPKLILELLLLGAGFTYFTIRADKGFLQPSEVITTSLDEVSSNAKPVIRQLQKFPKKLMELVELLPHEEGVLFLVIWLLEY